MGDVLSQAEIDALLGNNFVSLKNEKLSDIEVDAIGEIGNISMGAAATTLSAMVNRKVNITTPSVEVVSLREISGEEYKIPNVAVEVEYTNGLAGTNLLIIKEEDVKIITDLMLGGEGKVADAVLTEMDLSAIGEAMNQMIGSSSTSLSYLLDKSINISPPKVFKVQFDAEHQIEGYNSDEKVVKVKFKFKIENLVDSYMMQLIPIGFSKEVVNSLLSNVEPVEDSATAEIVKSNKGVDYSRFDTTKKKDQLINVKPVGLKEFDDAGSQQIGTSDESDNIGIILDVPLEVSVEIGRAQKMIKDILSFTSGSIIELNKSAGEPVDLLVNGKKIARGEVVVIDDNFGIRITDIISPANRVKKM